MAQKVFPRSLRSPKYLSADSSFYAENAYPLVWAKTCEVSNLFLTFCQKNLLTKLKNKTSQNKRAGKKKKMQTFISTRALTSNWMGTFHYSPILFKFSNASLAKKYNPIKTKRKTRSFLKKSNSKSFGRARGFLTKKK